MPYLDWREREITQEVRPHDVRGRELLLALNSSERDDLVKGLENIFVERAPGELRVDLPGRWILFWKERDGESRFLLAHPNESEWVATLALESDLGKSVIAKLRSLDSEQPISLGTIASEGAGVVGRVSNVEVVLSLR